MSWIHPGLYGARQALLDALGDAGARKRPTLSLKLRAAPDLQALWDLRPEVMTAVSQMYGESEGMRRLAEATRHFEGLLDRAGALTSPPRGHAMHRRT